MATFNTLPKDILHAIASFLTNDIATLRNCTLTSRALWEVATPELYRCIDGRCPSVENGADEEVGAVTAARQLKLLHVLAENKLLASYVKTFFSFRSDFDDDDDEDEVVPAKAAGHLTSLTKASLTCDYYPHLSFSAYIVANLDQYPELVDLTVKGLDIEKCIWGPTTNLKSLKWYMPMHFAWEESSWKTASFLLDAVAITCPALESLDILVSKSYDYWKGDNSGLDNQKAALVKSRVKHYRKSRKKTGSPTLARLKHFGLQVRDSLEKRAETDQELLQFVRKHRASLTSVNVPTDDPRIMVEICKALPNMKELAVSQLSIGGSDSEGSQTAVDSLPSLMPGIERLSIGSMGEPFSRSSGRFFAKFPNLKVLIVGDAENGDNPFGEDGRLDFDFYRTPVLDFIKALPPSIEELYIEINGEGLFVDEDEDFDYFCNMGLPIFKSQRRLHTVDIHAWISNLDGGLGELPEKGVFYRRLPYLPSVRAGLGNKKKAVWTSRMDCVYQEEDILVTKKKQIVGRSTTEYEGVDAQEIWLGGYVFGSDETGNEEEEEVWEKAGTKELGDSTSKSEDGKEDQTEGELDGEGKEEEKDQEEEEIEDDDDDDSGDDGGEDDKGIDRSWPFYKDMVASYPKFRQKFY